MIFYNERRKFEHRCKKLANEISRSGEFSELTDYDLRCLDYFCSQKYVEGIKTAKMASGRITAKICGSIRLTPDGLKWLYPKIDMKFLIPTLIAAAELIVIIVQAIMC